MDKNQDFFRKLCSRSFYFGQLLCWFTLAFTIWAFLNSDKDNLIELIFFSFITFSALFNIKFAIFKMGPIIFRPPKELSKNEYGELLEKVINISNSLILGFIQPLWIGCIGIIAKELENNPYQYLFAFLAFLFFATAFFLLSYRATWCKNEYLRVTDKAFIGF